MYADIDALLHEACPLATHYCFRKSCMIRDKALKEQDSCYAYAADHQRETARYFGFEVIEDDTPTIAETAAKRSEDVKPDPVNRPAHYTSGGIECIDAMQAAFGDEAVKDFCLCNAFKYLWRHQNKNGVEEWYTEVYKCISCCADTMMVNNERYRQPRFCANCGAAFTQEENDERSK